MRVEPPVSLSDPLMSWKEEAYQSLGSLNFESLRPQGRTESNIKDMQAEHEKLVKKKEKHDEIEQIGLKFAKSVKLSPRSPQAPLRMEMKRRRTSENLQPRKISFDGDEEAEECKVKEFKDLTIR